MPSEIKMADEHRRTDVISYEESPAEEVIRGELEKVRGVVRSQKTNIRITENDPVVSQIWIYERIIA